MGLVGTKAKSDRLTGSFGCLYIFLTHIIKIFLNIFIVLYLISKIYNLFFFITLKIYKNIKHKNCRQSWYWKSGNV